MKDIQALCKRVVIIANGQIYHDGSLEQIVDKFSGQKVVTLQMADARSLDSLNRLPNVLEIEAPSD